MTAFDSEPPREARVLRVLLIEDDADVALAAQALLDQDGRRRVVHAPTARAARAALARDVFDVALVDLSLPDADGFRLLEEISAGFPMTGLLCFSGRSDAAAAVRALRAGALDYVTKPASAATLREAVDAVASRVALRSAQVAPEARTTMPIGSSPAWLRTMSMIEAVARSAKTTVLITGEPGVGKEEAASLVHRMSARRDKPFVTVNAACLAPSMIESELFGHEAGAFTGAQRQHRGLFEQACGGTLFLDEIGELPLDMQAKLLRVLERHPFRRVGGDRPLQVDVRLVFATNRDLAARVQAGAFRADLHERLQVFELRLPPLRERVSDVERLALHFIAKLGHELAIPVEGLSAGALEALQGYRFPGNVRELRNTIERAIVLAGGGLIERRHLPPKIVGPLAPTSDPPAPGPSSDSVEEVLREHILRVYENAERNVTRTALALEMSRPAVRKRLQSYGVRPRAIESDHETEG